MVKLWWTTYGLLKMGRLTMGLGVFTTRQIGYHCSFFVLRFVCSVRAKAVRRSTRALGQAKRG